MRLNIPALEDLSGDQIAFLAQCQTFPEYLEFVEHHRGKPEDAKCLLCDCNRTTEPVYHNELWCIWQNPLPLPHTKHHLVAAYHRHITSHDLNSYDLQRLGIATLRTEEKLKITNGRLIMPFGIMRGIHVYATIIVPDGMGPVIHPVVDDPDDLRLIMPRILVFEKLRTGGHLRDLSKEELAIIAGRLF